MILIKGTIIAFIFIGGLAWGGNRLHRNADLNRGPRMSDVVSDIMLGAGELLLTAIVMTVAVFLVISL